MIVLVIFPFCSIFMRQNYFARTVVSASVEMVLDGVSLLDLCFKTEVVPLDLV